MACRGNLPASLVREGVCEFGGWGKESSNIRICLPTNGTSWSDYLNKSYDQFFSCLVML